MTMVIQLMMTSNDDGNNANADDGNKMVILSRVFYNLSLWYVLPIYTIFLYVSQSGHSSTILGDHYQSINNETKNVINTNTTSTTTTTTSTTTTTLSIWFTYVCNWIPLYI